MNISLNCRRTKTHSNINLNIFRALKDQGYQSDSTLVYKKRSDVEQQDPVEQKAAYIQLQQGGEVPLHGFRKSMPEKPKGELNEDGYFFYINQNYIDNHTQIHSHTTQ